MRALAVVLAVSLCAGAAIAGAPALAPVDAGGFTVAMPQGWTVQTDPGQHTVVAQQDPKRKDAAMVLFIVSASATATEDQALDVIAGKTVADLKVVLRGPAPGGTGKQLIADGTTGGIKVRLGMIAIGNGGGMAICLVVARTSEFDTLGGIGFLMSILGSVKVGPAAPATTAPGAPGRDAVMTPQYDSYHSLIIPPPSRQLALADLAGTWTNDSKALTNYYSTSTGNHTGYSASVGNETWVIDAKGTLSTKYHGANVTNTNVQAIDGTDSGTISLSPDGVISIMFKSFTKQTTIYVVRGWFVGADVTILKLQGPYYNNAPAADQIRTNNYLSRVLVRAR